jgi:formylglycine-generating enzyme required for sulfatase activity
MRKECCWSAFATALTIVASIMPGAAARAAVPQPAAAPEMVEIEPGSFMMGAYEVDLESKPAERPPHRVTIAHAFAIGKYEVTFEEYDRCTAAGRCPEAFDEGWSRGRHPVVNVSWNDAQQYAAWLSEVSGKHYRLPTEAEWEYAARAGSATAYWWGAAADLERANCRGCASEWAGKRSETVGSFPPNAWGLYDTAGNVWEWVQDCWHQDYAGAPADGRAWDDSPDGKCLRVLRGGAWSFGPEALRSPGRMKFPASYRAGAAGFRLVLAPAAAPD